MTAGSLSSPDTVSPMADSSMRRTRTAEALRGPLPSISVVVLVSDCIRRRIAPCSRRQSN